nr:aminoglycoside phosphotransferase family protein [Kineosporia rhizophila]
MIRFGENAVFQVGPDLIARVARPHADLESLRRPLAVARWLESHAVPAVKALPIEQPIQTSAGAWVSLWESLGRDAAYGAAVDVGQLVRRLHDLPLGEVDLPKLRPFDRAERRIEHAPIGGDDREFLWRRLGEVRRGYSDLNWQLGFGPVHGDASVGNVLLDQQGTPTLIDLDEFAIGPREWDLILTAIYYDRFGWHTEAEYSEFVDAYGVDIMEWDGYEALADVREFLMMTWMAQRADEGPKLAGEVALRLESLRTGGSRQGWNPF